MKKGLEMNGSETVLMVKKAEDLKSLDDISAYTISDETCKYFNRYYKSVDAIVKLGRHYALYCNEGIIPLKKRDERKMELVFALESAGYLRPIWDFAMTQSLLKLYQCIFGADCCINVEELSNEQYETFEKITDEELKKIESILVEALSTKEFNVISYHFGLDGYGIRNLDTVAQYYGNSRGFIRYIRNKALRKLRHPKWGLKEALPARFVLS